jgi:hypothetical protein
MKKVLTFVLVLGLFGCGTYREIIVEPVDGGDTVQWANGTKYYKVTCEQINFEVKFYQSRWDSFLMQVDIENCSKKPFCVDQTNYEVYFFDKFGAPYQLTESEMKCYKRYYVVKSLTVNPTNQYGYSPIIHDKKIYKDLGWRYDFISKTTIDIYSKYSGTIDLPYSANVKTMKLNIKVQDKVLTLPFGVNGKVIYAL